MTASALHGLLEQANTSYAGANTTGDLAVVVDLRQYGIASNETAETLGRPALRQLPNETQVSTVHLVTDVARTVVQRNETTLELRSGTGVRSPSVWTRWTRRVMWA